MSNILDNSISHAAALVLIRGHGLFDKLRLVTVAVYNVLLLAFCIRFGLALSSWDSSIPGRCFAFGIICHWTPRSVNTVCRDDALAYFIITSFYLFAVVLFTIISVQRHVSTTEAPLYLHANDAWTPRDIGGLALPMVVVQYPVHLALAIVLGLSNRHKFLNSDDEERKWGIGQILAVGMLVVVLLDCLRGYIGRFPSSKENFASFGSNQC